MHLVIPDQDGELVVVHFARTDAMQELVLVSEAIAHLPDIMYDESLPFLANHAAFSSFLIDVRAMVAFLSGPGPNPWKDDQFARNFADGRWTPADEAEVADAMAPVVKEIHKQLAHFTTIRMGDGSRTFPEDWQLEEEQVRQISDQMTTFYNRFAAVASMPQVGVYAPFHNSDGAFVTMAEMKAKTEAPDARKMRHVRATGIRVDGVVGPAPVPGTA